MQDNIDTMWSLCEKVRLLSEENQKLEKEANWLACALCHVCRNNSCEDCVLDPDNGDACPGMNRENWRESARKEVEKLCKN